MKRYELLLYSQYVFYMYIIESVAIIFIIYFVSGTKTQIFSLCSKRNCHEIIMTGYQYLQ